MPPIKLTEPIVKSLGSSERMEVADALCRGLRMRISPKVGNVDHHDRTWSFVYRDGAKVERFTLGKWPMLSVADARARADDVRVRVRKGTSPAEDKRDAKAVRQFDVDDLCGEYLLSHAAKMRSADQYAAFLKPFQQKFGHRDPTTLKRSELVSWLEGIAATKPVSANRVHSHISALMTWAIKMERVETHPLAGVKKPAKEQAKERVLRPSEIACLWSEGPKHLTAPAYDALRLILLTGARPGEVVGMRLSELEDLETALPFWSLPRLRAKSDRSRPVPLSRLAMAIIRGRIERLERNGTEIDFLFPSKTGFAEPATKAFLPQAVAAFRERASKRTPWTAHDLRRTAATLASEGGIREEIVGVLLGHAASGVTSRVYIRNKFLPETRQAVDAIERAVLKACGVVGQF